MACENNYEYNKIEMTDSVNCGGRNWNVRSQNFDFSLL